MAEPDWSVPAPGAAGPSRSVPAAGESGPSRLVPAPEESGPSRLVPAPGAGSRPAAAATEPTAPATEPTAPATEPTAPATEPAAPATDARPAAHPIREVLLVLGVSLGQSAVYSMLAIAEKLTRPEPLGQQTTTMNSSVTPDRPWLDLAYQVAGIFFPLVPALFALYLLKLTADRARIGFDLRRPWFDLGWGWALAAAIGIPGLALYFLAKAFNLNTTVQPANLTANWWTIPVLVGLAIMNGVLEEVVIVGYFFVRMRQAGWDVAAVLVASAVIRGAYHLYQGFGGGVGNLLMGLVFGLAYLKAKRVGPLVVAHVVLDLFAFVGYSLLAPYTDWF